MTAVEAAFASEICTRAVCTAMTEMPNIPAVIAIPEFGSKRCAQLMQQPRNDQQQQLQ
jgi:hypothetical protein